MSRSHRTPGFVYVFAGIAVLFLGLPLLALVVQVPWPSFFALLSTDTALEALRLSLLTASLATFVGLVIGTPLALLLARASGRVSSWLRALVLVPMLMPPVVSGVALLSAFGRYGLVGSGLFDIFGVQLSFSMMAVVLAEAFVSMPFLVLVLESGFRTVNPRLEEAAATLGASPWLIFRQVTVPASLPAIAAGALLTWARALGEFGATITFAGNVPGQTQSLPLAVYTLLQTDRDSALALSVLLIAICIGLLVLLRDRFLPVGGRS